MFVLELSKNIKKYNKLKNILNEKIQYLIQNYIIILSVENGTEKTF